MKRKRKYPDVIRFLKRSLFSVSALESSMSRIVLNARIMAGYSWRLAPKTDSPKRKE